MRMLRINILFLGGNAVTSVSMPAFFCLSEKLNAMIRSVISILISAQSPRYFPKLHPEKGAVSDTPNIVSVDSRYREYIRDAASMTGTYILHRIILNSYLNILINFDILLRKPCYVQKILHGLSLAAVPLIKAAVFIQLP